MGGEDITFSILWWRAFQESRKKAKQGETVLDWTTTRVNQCPPHKKYSHQGINISYIYIYSCMKMHRAWETRFHSTAPMIFLYPWAWDGNAPLERKKMPFYSRCIRPTKKLISDARQHIERSIRAMCADSTDCQRSLLLPWTLQFGRYLVGNERSPCAIYLVSILPTEPTLVVCMVLSYYYILRTVHTMNCLNTKFQWHHHQHINVRITKKTTPPLSDLYLTLRVDK